MHIWFVLFGSRIDIDRGPLPGTNISASITAPTPSH